MAERRPLTEQELAALGETLPEWQVAENALTRTFTFASFPRALAFMVEAGFIAEQMDHHPDWSNTYRRVTVRLSTHDLGHKVSALDVDLARAMNGLL